MKRNNIGYLFKEGVRGIFLHGLMSFAAICVTVACMVIMGTFALVILNMNELIISQENELEILAFVDETYPEAQARSVGSQINMIPNVANATFVTRQEALDNFIAKQNDAALFEGLDASTFRDRFVVTLVNNDQMQDTAAQLREIEGIADVEVEKPYALAKGFATLQQILRVVSTIIIAVLLVVSLLIISNTVKLALYDRKEEIAIMRMVGATSGFIRWPYVIEGLIIGIVAAAAAFFIEWGLYDLVVVRVQRMDTMRMFVNLVPFADVRVMFGGACLITGFLVGVFGSLMSIRKFLKV